MKGLEDFIKKQVPLFKWAAFNFQVVNEDVKDFSMDGLFDTFGYDLSPDERDYSGDKEWVWTKDSTGKLIRSLFNDSVIEQDAYEYLCNVLNTNKSNFLKFLKGITNFHIYDSANYKCVGIIYIVCVSPRNEEEDFIYEASDLEGNEHSFDIKSSFKGLKVQFYLTEEISSKVNVD